jgi:predicted nucleotidyltransferase
MSGAMLHLKDRDLAVVKRILAKYLPGYEVWAFGSRVHGGHHQKFSDLDLVVKNLRPIPDDVMRSLKSAFAQSELPIQVDIALGSELGEIFRKNIEIAHHAIQ